MPQNSFNPDPKYAQERRRWHHIDADGQVLGRIATRAATLLRGKHKRFFTPAVDCGDFVVVTNAKKIKLTGNKLEVKHYFSHSGYAKGAKVMPMKLQMERDPRRVVMLAVKRMLDTNRLRGPQLKRLKIYVGPENPHANEVRAAAGAGSTEETKAHG
ncbi:MAG: 50S ribosomal protein L13 [Elusimicrobia bacterium]|nr:50S ribosomal protein L13 [Elusimicrobiota bacterium]